MHAIKENLINDCDFFLKFNISVGLAAMVVTRPGGGGGYSPGGDPTGPRLFTKIVP